MRAGKVQLHQQNKTGGGRRTTAREDNAIISKMKRIIQCKGGTDPSDDGSLLWKSLNGAWAQIGQ